MNARRVGAHSRVSLNSLSSWNYDLDQDLQLWRSIGVDHVGLHLGLVPHDDAQPVVDTIVAEGLRVATVAGPAPPLTWGATTDLSTTEAARRAVGRAVDLAAAVGARSAYLVTGGAGGATWEDAAERFSAFVGPVADDARARGVAVAIEPTSSLRADLGIVFNLRDTVALARQAGIGVVVDLQACWLEPEFARTVRRNIELVEAVQVSDFHVGTHDTPNRVVPGDGDIPLERLMGVLLDAGFDGAFDIEVLGPRIEEEGYESALARSIEHVSAILTRLGA